MSVIYNFQLPPVSAARTLLTCQHCIVGCGYHVYRWPVGSQGSLAPENNALHSDFRTQASALASVPCSSMHTTILDEFGVRQHILIVPDRSCVVNKGLYSTRGGQLAKVLFSPEAPTSVRLREPLVRVGDRLFPITWDQAFEMFADLAVRTLESSGSDGLLFNCFDHGGGGGGFENTWGTGKLMFSAIGTRMVRIHNRPAYNSECHASREMGVSELNNSYEDAQIADTLFVAGANPYETQSNYFLVHWLPNLRGETGEKKREITNRDTAEPAKIIIVDPRRTPTLAICEKVLAPDQVLHLDLKPGTDTVLFNALLSYAVEKGWHAQKFIQKHTRGFEEAVAANMVSLEECSRITGVPVERIRKAAHWAYEPLKGGERRRTLLAYEKGIIWGNDNYRVQSALVNLALATHNVGRRGTGVVRLGGHQEGYVRPPYPGGRPAENIDRAIVEGRGNMLTIWGTNPIQSTANVEEFERIVRERSALVSDALRTTRHSAREKQREAVFRSMQDGGLFVTVIDLYHTRSTSVAHLLLAAAQPGEMNLTSMNGERRMRLSERFMDPPGDAMPDCLIAAGIANRMRIVLERRGDAETAERFKGFDWSTEEDAFNDGFRRTEGVDNQGGKTSFLVSYERLRRAGNNGVQLPVKGYQEGRLIGTEMLYLDGRFDTDDGRARFLPSPWSGYLEKADQQRRKYPFWINNGRVNHIWQTAYHDKLFEFRTKRFLLPLVEMNPVDAASLELEAGDLVEIYNDVGSIFACAYPETDICSGQVFVQFAHSEGTVGRLISEAVDRNMVPYYKGVWANIRKSGFKTANKSAVSFKSRRYGSS